MFMLFWCRFFWKPLRPRGWTVSRQRRFHLPFAALRRDFRWPPGSVHRRPPRGSTSHLQLLRWICLFKTAVLLIYEWSSGEPYEWNVNFIVLHPKFHIEKICQERFLVGIQSDQPTTTIYACWGPTLWHVKQNIQPACFWKIDQFITIHHIRNKLNLRDAPYLSFFMTFDHDQTPVLCNPEVIK